MHLKNYHSDDIHNKIQPNQVQWYFLVNDNQPDFHNNYLVIYQIFYLLCSNVIK